MGIFKECVSGCGPKAEVAGGEEIQSTVAYSRLHIIFKTVELLSLVVNSLSLKIFKQRLDMYLSELLWRRFLLWLGIWVLHR